MTTLTQMETARYARQMKIAGMGEAGQKRLKEASLFLCGLGGLGSVIAYYLAAAGVGHLRVAEKDELELSNLNRQLLYTTDDLQKPKASTGGARLQSLNPLCRVEAIQTEAAADNALELARGCSLILDGTDNFATRRILNRASLDLGIPYVFAGVLELSGMLTVFIPGKTACFECLFSYGDFPLDQPGVLGPLPGMVGAMQALEAVKLIAWGETALANRLLMVNGSDLSFKSLKTGPNPDCPACAASRED
jgi:molybdopterin/thiamine biosynthesis adenylyltransferase